MEKKQHPSYGMIQLSRSSIGGTGTALFGSSIMHNDVIRLTISNGFMEREDSIHTHRNEELVFFLIQPSNLSVLSEESLLARIYGLMTVL